MSDFGGEVMAEVLAERALVRPQIIPLVPLTNQYRHQDHMDLKDYKSKVRPTVGGVQFGLLSDVQVDSGIETQLMQHFNLLSPLLSSSGFNTLLTCQMFFESIALIFHKPVEYEKHYKNFGIGKATTSECSITGKFQICIEGRVKLHVRQKCS